MILILAGSNILTIKQWIEIKPGRQTAIFGIVLAIVGGVLLSFEILNSGQLSNSPLSSSPTPVARLVLENTATPASSPVLSKTLTNTQGDLLVTPIVTMTNIVANTPTVPPTDAPTLIPTVIPSDTPISAPTHTPTVMRIGTPPLPTPTPVVISVTVPSNSENGVRVDVSTSGWYQIKYIEGAFSPWAESSADSQGWATHTQIFINREIEWGITSFGLPGPINFDAYVGADGYYSTVDGAVNATTGKIASLRQLKAGDYINVVVVDERGQYSDNRGNVELELIRISP